ncbi:hypothetical protein FH972_000866 [Carpinus fangiana]|uniref:F-box domain-containing protein n=1 Tax=Carpinus fangiana TaxID=176857 RepID=A0A5N6QA09_9ROSI|nr:hypothetical protein FH972_000866 [Carpinus fangiana]
MDPPPDPAEDFRNWLELPRDLTASILLRLGAIEILTSAQWVCSPWRKLCNEPSMWLAIDMRKPGKHWKFPQLEKMCREAVDRSCGQLVDIKVEDFGTDELLRHIADNSSQLKRLGLVRCRGISDGGLSGVAAKLPLLEELSISYCCTVSKEALEAVGRCCPRLKSLQFNNWFRVSKQCLEEAFAIAENMSELRCLNLVGTFLLTNDSLQAILDGCPHLESLDLRRCTVLSQAGTLGRCAEQIKNLRLPDDSIDDYEFKKYFFENIPGLESPLDIDFYDFDFDNIDFEVHNDLEENEDFFDWDVLLEPFKQNDPYGLW